MKQLNKQQSRINKDVHLRSFTALNIFESPVSWNGFGACLATAPEECHPSVDDAKVLSLALATLQELGGFQGASGARSWGVEP